MHREMSKDKPEPHWLRKNSPLGLFFLGTWALT